ncbi:Glucuronide carrier protein [Caballeronia udeis]|uniref:Glucuronide carrier protein n=1 Tax=Caballeronia udeis TaxID=1232866 RepID=A0A158IDV0_9BURK|nr:MFS transporter [Caballeronia udeis]SAL54449.1 Glucuronide carrier protein [Caballeronia udeis]
MPSTSHSSRSIGPMRLCGYGAGGFANSLAVVPASMLLLYFLTEFVRLEPWVAGLVLALPKLWDVLVDMPIGRYSDQLALRAHGRLRVGMWSALALVVLLPMTFFHPALTSKPLLAAFYVVIQVLQATAFTVFGVTYFALAGDLAADAVQRNKLLTFSTLGASLATIGLVVCMPFMIRVGGSGEHGYRNMAVMVALAMALMFVCFYGAVRNAPAQPAALSEARAEMSLRQGIAAIARNWAFLAIVVVVIMLGTAGGCLNALLTYENRYLLGRSAEDLFLLIGPILIGGFAGLPLAVPVLRRLDSSKTLRIGLLGLAATFVFYWSGLVYVSIPVIVICGAVFGIFNTIVGIALQAAALDTAKSFQGGPSLGLYLGMFLTAQKLGSSLGGVVSGGLLSIIGYQADAPVSPALHQSIALSGLIGPLVPLLIACLGTHIYGVYAPPPLTTDDPAGPRADTI